MSYSKEFLKQISCQKQRTIFVKLTALDINDIPIEYLEGVVSSGSITIDGQSSVRRSINLTLNISEITEIKNYIWAVKTKCKVEIGMKNTIDSKYDPIIWFNQGIYILTSFSSSISTNQIQTISLQGRDKMCLLDGSVGGLLVAGGSFDTYDLEDSNGYIEKIKYPIKEIIMDLVHHLANEPFYNIIVNDLDIDGMELLEYKATDPLYLWRRSGQDLYLNGTTFGTQQCFIDGNNTKTTLQDPSIVYEPLYNIEESSNVTKLRFTQSDSIGYYGVKIEYGNVAGYKIIDLIYPGTLEAKAGESITSILDKIIKNMLNNYEYFYDIDGRFIFQKRKSYDVEEFSPVRKDSEGTQYILSYAEAKAQEITYEFTDFELITAFSENPNIANVKNDFTVWGERSGVDGDNIPIHMRYAIDNYPVQYTTIEVNEADLKDYNEKYGLNVQPQQSITFIASDNFKHGPLKIEDACPSMYRYQIYYVDWREVLWQMQSDYRKFHHLSNFEQKIAKANQQYYPSGKTGYEHYYMDIEGFLHQELYNPHLLHDILTAVGGRKFTGTVKDLQDIEAGQLNPQLYKYQFYIKGLSLKEVVADINRIKTVLESWKFPVSNNIDDYHPKEDDNGYAPPPVDITDALGELHLIIMNIQTLLSTKSNDWYCETLVINDDDRFGVIDSEHLFWNKKVYEARNQLNFWIDFMSGDSQLMRDVGVPNIQARPRVETADSVKAIEYEKIPNIIYCEKSIPDSSQQKDRYSYFYVGDKMNKMFSTASRGISAVEYIQDMVYNYAQTTEAVQITCVPIYHLEPNTKIHIKSNEYNIDNDYIIQSITIPLNYDGTMSISATKARKRIF